MTSRFARQPDSATNREYLDSFLLALRARNSPLTLASYRIDIGNYLYHCEQRDQSPIAAAPAFIDEYLSSLTSYQYTKPGSITKPASPRTRNRIRSSLLSFYNSLTRRKLIPSNPVLEVKSFRVPRRLIPTLAEDMIREARIRCPEDFLPALEFLLSSGVRASELINLNWSRVNLEQRTARVTGKGNKERLVRFSRRSSELLGKLNRQGDAVFIVRRKRMTYRQLRLRLRKLDLWVDNRPLWAHLFRHSMASHLVDSGVSIPQVRDLLGHENIATTSIYLHPTTDQVEKIEKAMDEI